MYDSEESSRKSVQLSYQLWYVLNYVRRRLQREHQTKMTFTEIIQTFMIHDENYWKYQLLDSLLPKHMLEKLYPYDPIVIKKDETFVRPRVVIEDGKRELVE